MRLDTISLLYQSLHQLRVLQLQLTDLLTLLLGAGLQQIKILLHHLLLHLQGRVLYALIAVCTFQLRDVPLALYQLTRLLDLHLQHGHTLHQGVRFRAGVVWVV